MAWARFGLAKVPSGGISARWISGGGVGATAGCLLAALVVVQGANDANGADGKMGTNSADALRVADLEGTAFIGFTRESADTFHTVAPGPTNVPRPTNPPGPTNVPRQNPPTAPAGTTAGSAALSESAVRDQPVQPRTGSRRYSSSRRASAARTRRARAEGSSQETGRKRTAKRGLFTRIKTWWKTHFSRMQR